MQKKYSGKTIGESFIVSLKQAVAYEKGKNILGLHIRRMTIAPLPDYSPAQIRKIRENLGFSRSTFAFVLGVSDAAIELWETGKSHPLGPAKRMLMIMEKDRRLLEESGIIVTTY